MADPHREEVAKLEALYAANPEGRVFTHLAEAYRKAGELARAREILEDGLQRHADYASAHVVLGRVLSDMGARDEAARSFRRVLELDRHNLVALRSLGELATEAGQTDEALRYYRELAALDPSDEGLRTTVQRLEAQREAGDTAAAEATAATPLEAPVAEPSAGAPEAGAVPDEATAESIGEEPVAAAPSAEPEPAAQAEPFDLEPVTWDLGAAGEDQGVVEEGAAFELTWTEEPSAGGEPPAAAFAENWEETIGGEAEPLPGDLAALSEAAQAEDAEGAAPEPADEWVVSSDWTPDASALELPTPDFSAVDEEAPAIPEVPLEAKAEATSQPWSESGVEPAPQSPETGEPEVADTEPGPRAGEELAAASQAGVPGPEEWTVEEQVEAAPAASGWDDAVEGGPAAGTPWYELDEAGDEPQTYDLEPPGFLESESEPAFDSAPAGAYSGEDDGGELVTETMAEVYFAQGFYGRAAEVYRSLVRQRPGDQRLTERLREAESLMSWGAPSAAETAADVEAHDVWLEGVESAWTGGGGVAGAEETPYAWAEPRVAEEPGGPPIGDYFRELLSWRPGTALAGGSAPGEEPPATASETALGGSAYEAAETEAPAPLASSEEEPWRVDEAPRAPELPEAVSAAGADEEPVEDDEDLEMFRSWLKSLKK